MLGLDAYESSSEDEVQIQKPSPEVRPLLLCLLDFRLYFEQSEKQPLKEDTQPQRIVPNLDIPPSPPGSPDPAANAKFQHFLSLKHQGVHFNAKLATSSSLKNP
ncbi:hypothetical protein N7470_005609 [Penicillium chermesinum]|nr:hypothetical protein N7470_005609 [Penicillium chermesinum]